MSDTPFIKFYPSDFLAGTSGLSPAERGVYITLLCLIYEANGAIKRDDSRLSRRCGAPKAAFIRTLDGLIAEGKICDDGGMISNKRAEKAIVDRANRVENAAIAAHSRWTAQEQKNEQNQGPSDAGALPKQCVEVCQPEPEPDKEDKSSLYLCDQAFDAFNQIASMAKWPLVKSRTKGRQSALTARIKECGGIDAWRSVMEKAAKSDFLLGIATGTTPASFDWLNAPKNFTKVMEGNYDNKGGGNGTWRDKPESKWTKADRDAERMRWL